MLAVSHTFISHNKANKRHARKALSLFLTLSNAVEDQRSKWSIPIRRWWQRWPSCANGL